MANNITYQYNKDTELQTFLQQQGLRDSSVSPESKELAVKTKNQLERASNSVSSAFGGLIEAAKRNFFDTGRDSSSNTVPIIQARDLYKEQKGALKEVRAAVLTNIVDPFQATFTSFFADKDEKNTTTNVAAIAKENKTTPYLSGDDLKSRFEDALDTSDFSNKIKDKSGLFSDTATDSLSDFLTNPSPTGFSSDFVLPNVGFGIPSELINAVNSQSADYSYIQDHRIRIRAKTAQTQEIYGDISNGPMRSLYNTNGMIFPITPTITGYNQAVNMGSIAPTHSNQEYYMYNNTSSMNLNISGEFIAQNNQEAEYLYACLHFLKCVTKSRFGDSDPKRGFTPPVLLLSGYGNFMFPDLNILIKGYTYELPNNVDYIKVALSGNGDAWVPTKTTINIDCVVQNTPKKNRQFNLDDFRDGTLIRRTKGFI